MAEAAGTSASMWHNHCSSRDTHSRMHRTTSRTPLEISKEETPQPLGNLCQQSSVCTAKKYFADMQLLQERWITLPTSGCANVNYQHALKYQKKKTESLTQTTGSSPCPDFCFQSGIWKLSDSKWNTPAPYRWISVIHCIAFSHCCSQNTFAGSYLLGASDTVLNHAIPSFFSTSRWQGKVSPPPMGTPRFFPLLSFTPSTSDDHISQLEAWTPLTPERGDTGGP